MGEVYRARDSKLNRDVAIKVLLPAVANDPDRLARFSREAQVLASLNHSNIAAIYGLEDAGDVRALVMELVEGPTLADRIARGPMPIDEALPIARQIADALETAHEQGIVHRDLKPANIKVRDDGTVKVLDFGLAKAVAPTSASSATLMNSPTLSIHATQQGVILGTAAYMSPEQARGGMVDKRSDIWAFGVVLYEMLTGQPLFAGASLTDVLASVVKDQPDLSVVPARLRRLIQRCLEKDAKKRLRDIGDARLEIDEALSAPAAEPSPSAVATVPRARSRVLPIVLGSVAAIAVVAALATWALTRTVAPPSLAVTRFVIAPPPAQPLSIHGDARDIAVSPDGTLLAYRIAVGKQSQLAIRRFDQLEAQALTGMSGAHSPFFSPDGRWIGFWEGSDLKKVSITGGSAITLASAGLSTRGFSWGDDNAIVFATDTFPGLLSISADGGEPKLLTKSDAAQHELGHWFPSVLPGGRGVLFTIAVSEAENAQVAVLDLKTGQRKTLIRGGSAAQYVDTGHLVYAAAGALRAVRFDLARLEVTGDPVQVVDHVMVASTGEPNFAVSRQGTLVYVPGGAAQTTVSQLVWVDRKGHEEPINAPPHLYVQPRVSPDGTRLALMATDQERDIWTWDLARQTLTRVTFDPGLDVQPVWTPDSRRIIFSSGRAGAFHLYAHAADGTGADEQLTAGESQQFANSVTPDGTHVVGFEARPKVEADVVQFALGASASVQQPSEALVHTPFAEFNAEISPDGHYLAYQSNESGKDEVYVRPYPKVNDGRWQISIGGGTRPLWARNGRELFFIDPSNALMSVPVQIAGATFSAGKVAARVLDARYAVPLPYRSYDVSPDGQRFLMIKEGPEGDKPSPPNMTVVLNWFEELKAKLPIK